MFVFFSGSGDHRDLHSFPTRRSSDLTRRGIPVIGHVGLTPQAVNALGGYGARGRSNAEHAQILDDADRKSTRLNSSHVRISYAVFCLKKKKTKVKNSKEYIKT